MTDFIKHLGLPVRYAFIGLLGGLIFLAIFSTTTSLNEIPWDSLAGIAFGASLGGCVLQGLNKNEKNISNNKGDNDLSPESSSPSMTPSVKKE